MRLIDRLSQGLPRCLVAHLKLDGPNSMRCSTEIMKQSLKIHTNQTFARFPSATDIIFWSRRKVWTMIFPSRIDPVQPSRLRPRTWRFPPTTWPMPGRAACRSNGSPPVWRRIHPPAGGPDQRPRTVSCRPRRKPVSPPSVAGLQSRATPTPIPTESPPSRQRRAGRGVRRPDPGGKRLQGQYQAALQGPERGSRQPARHQVLNQK